LTDCAQETTTNLTLIALKIGLCSSNYNTIMASTIMQFTENSAMKREYS